jgi:hypothetical protein
VPPGHTAAVAALSATLVLYGCPGACPKPPCEEPTPPPPEECNGLDDDGDGQVDEGLADLDGDGLADCVDRD